MEVRPTSDKLKSAIFNVLYSMTGTTSLEGIVVLDIFAGTGALGIEALSRGANKCYFIDRALDSVNIIKKNLNSIGLDDDINVRILHTDHIKGVKALQVAEEKFDLIFLDPPYNKNFSTKTIEIINTCDILSKKGIIISEHSIEEKMPDRLKNHRVRTEKVYKDKVLSFYSIGW